MATDMTTPATKQDLQDLATVTKQDLQNLARTTKKDFEVLEERLKVHFGATVEEFKKCIEVINTDQWKDHEKRLTSVEVFVGMKEVGQ